MWQISIKNDVSPLLKLAIPLIFTGLVQSSLSFFETIFLAQLGEHVMAAGALVNWLFATLIVVLFGTFSAVSVLIARKYGAKEKAQIILVLRDGLLTAVLLFIPTFFLFWNISSILLLFGQSAQVAALAKAYLHALAWGLFPKFILIVLFEFILGLGHSRIIMTISLMTTPIYIFLSFVLIFGKLGLPALGIAGAGWGMTIADWLITSTLLILLFNSKRYRAYLRGIFTLKKPYYLWEIFHIGFPMGAMYCIEVGFFFAVTLIMGTFSVAALAANQIVMQYLGPLMNVIFSIAQAVTIRMGHFLGANQVLDSKKTARVGLLFSVGFMSLIALCYWLIPHVLIAVDFDLRNPEYANTIRLASSFLFAAAFFQILESMRIATFGALRAFKDTRFTLFISVISFWIIPLPIGYFLAIYLRIGGAGLWWGITIGSCFSVVMLLQRLKSKFRMIS